MENEPEKRHMMEDTVCGEKVRERLCVLCVYERESVCVYESE